MSPKSHPQCKKIGYSTYKDARDALLNTRIHRELRGKTKRQEQRVYRCPACSQWHLTKYTRSIGMT